MRTIEAALKFVNGKKTELATELHPDVKEDIRGMFDMTEAERAYRWLVRLISIEWGGCLGPFRGYGPRVRMETM